MVDVLILAIALSMDSFAVSIGLGAKHTTPPTRLGLLSGLYFGAFQGFMPLIGYLGGKGLLGWIDVYAPWVAFILLALIGGNMIREAFSDRIEEDIADITHRAMLTLALATSIDAMAAGFSLNLLAVNPHLACGIIGITTFIFSFAGVYIGDRSGTLLESKAEFSGGVVLILVGFRILTG